MPVQVPAGHVWLVLLRKNQSYFYLEIPIATIRPLCLKPFKYLLFLAWCILGVEGALALAPQGEEIDTDSKEDLEDRRRYYFIMEEGQGTSFHVSEYLCHTICPMKILPTPSTSRSSRSGRMCLHKLRKLGENFAPICWSVTPVVSGQEWVNSWGKGCTSFPLRGVRRYVLQSCAGKIYNCLPSPFCYFSGFGSS